MEQRGRQANAYGPGGEPLSPEPVHEDRIAWTPLLAFVLLAVAGLGYVKWHPYVLKGLAAAGHHGIGTSILAAGGGTAMAGWRAGLAYTVTYGLSIWKALVLALLLGAGIQVLLSRRTVRRVFAGRWAWARAAGAATPSMMCSCCAAPITVSLLRRRADASAALAYWLANPVLNPATIIFIGFLLGWDWAMVRVVLGLALVAALSWIGGRLMPPGRDIPPPADDPASDPATHGYGRAYARVLLRLTVQLVPEYLLLVFVLGAIRAWLFPAMTPLLGHAVWLPPLLAAAGTLFVIPTAGEVPIIQALQHAGLGSAGTAALLLTLPALNLPSLAMLARVLPLRVLAVLGVGTFGFGLLAAVAAPLFAA